MRSIPGVCLPGLTSHAGASCRMNAGRVYWLSTFPEDTVMRYPVRLILPVILLSIVASTGESQSRLPFNPDSRREGSSSKRTTAVDALVGWDRLYRNQYGAARDTFRKALQQNPLNPAALRGIAILNDHEDANVAAL